MNNLVSLRNRRWFVLLALSLLTVITVSSPWFTAIAYACQNQGAGC
jgi:hypothetical protein